MRQESKLNYVKKVSRLSNYKNICKIVAKKHSFGFVTNLSRTLTYFTPSVSYIVPWLLNWTNQLEVDKSNIDLIR